MTNRDTIMYHNLKEAEIHENLFDTSDERISLLLFSQSALQQIWSGHKRA